MISFRLTSKPQLLALFGAILLSNVASAAPIQWTAASGGNDNWYDYVSTSIFTGVSFPAARNAALASSHLGMTGYLATVTSAAEEDFIEGSFPFVVGFGFTGSAWLGASDVAVPGEWRWVDGPEAGQLITYSDWRSNEPRAEGDYLALYINRQPNGTLDWFTLTGTDRTFGYVIEYGDGIPDQLQAIPEPSSLALFAAGATLVGVLRRRR